MASYFNTLQISTKGKGIPYGGFGEVREDGDANYGFKYLKGSEALLDEIPELKRDDALHHLVRAVNGIHTGLLSIGSNSREVAEEQGFRFKGYVEISWDSISMVADAQNYFPVFFHFDRYLREVELPISAAFTWELISGTFIDSHVDGFTCAIDIETDFSATQKKAKEAWAATLDILGTYLGSIPPQGTDRIYFDLDNPL